MTKTDMFEEVATLLKNTKEAFDTVCNGELLYRLKQFESYVEGLFSFAKFKEGEKIQLKKKHTFDHGWKYYNPTFSKSAVAVVVRVDWNREHGFMYDLVFDEQLYMATFPKEDKGKVCTTDQEHSIFMNWKECDLKTVKEDHLIH